jgi:hypothetical protein
MSVDPKEQNAALQRLIGANKQRLADTQKTIRDLQKRAGNGVSKGMPRRAGHEKN